MAMKLKKALKLVKEQCSDEACEKKTCKAYVDGDCPFYSMPPENWDIDAIAKMIKNLKRLKKGK